MEKKDTVAFKKFSSCKPQKLNYWWQATSTIPSLYSSGCGLGTRQLTDGLEARIQLKTFLWLTDRPTKSWLLLCECFRRGKRTPLLHIRDNAVQTCALGRHLNTMLEQKPPFRRAISGQYHDNFCHWDQRNWNKKECGSSGSTKH